MSKQTKRDQELLTECLSNLLSNKSKQFDSIKEAMIYCDRLYFHNKTKEDKSVYGVIYNLLSSISDMEVVLRRHYSLMQNLLRDISLGINGSEKPATDGGKGVGKPKPKRTKK